MSTDEPQRSFTAKLPGRATVVDAAALTIPSVPAYITRKQVIEALGVLGIDPSETRSVSFGTTAVQVEVYASERPSGRQSWRFTSDGENVATHCLTLPILEKEPTP